MKNWTKPTVKVYTKEMILSGPFNNGGEDGTSKTGS